MRTFGRTAAIISIVGFVTLFLLLVPDLRHAVEQPGVIRSLYDVVGAVTAVALIVAWLTAIFHWGTRYSGDPDRKSLWGAAVIFGAFVGAWAYWFSANSRIED